MILGLLFLLVLVGILALANLCLAPLFRWQERAARRRMLARFRMPEAPKRDEGLARAIDAYQRQMKLKRPLTDKEIQMLQKAARQWN